MSVTSVNGTKRRRFHDSSGVLMAQRWGLCFSVSIHVSLRERFFCRLYANDTLLGMDVTDCGRNALQGNITALYGVGNIF